MNTAVVNVKVEPEIKEKAQAIAADLGFSLSAILNGYLRHLIQTRTIHFESTAEEPSEYLVQLLRESRQDINAGRVSPKFTNAKKAIAWLNDSDRKYADQIRQKVQQAV